MLAFRSVFGSVILVSPRLGGFLSRWARGQRRHSKTADGAMHAFLWQNSSMIDLGTLNPSGGVDSYSWASGINNLGQVVGTSSSDWIDDGSGWGSNLPHAFLWQDGSMTDLHSNINWDRWRESSRMREPAQAQPPARAHSRDRLRR